MALPSLDHIKQNAANLEAVGQEVVAFLEAVKEAVEELQEEPEV